MNEMFGEVVTLSEEYSQQADICRTDVQCDYNPSCSDDCSLDDDT
jgi:hypothetical protein